jgi:hypothetical protein
MGVGNRLLPGQIGRKEEAAHLTSPITFKCAVGLLLDDI